jgi:hypothetical protein
MADETLAELFARDPFTYTQEDLDKIIAYYREARSAFNLGGKRAPKDTSKVNLDELGMGISIDSFKRSAT